MVRGGIIKSLLAGGLLAMLLGCSAKNVKDVGVGMQIGASGGGPLSGAVAVAGIATEIIGGTMGDDKTAESEMAPMDAEAIRKKEYHVWMQRVKRDVQKEFLDTLKPDANSTFEQLEGQAKQYCLKIDQRIANKQPVNIQRETLKRLKNPDVIINEGTSNTVPYVIDSNPFYDCTGELTAAGERAVAKLKTAKRKDQVGGN